MNFTLHGRTGHLEIDIGPRQVGNQLHGRTGHLEKNPPPIRLCRFLHGRTGHLEMYTGATAQYR